MADILASDKNVARATNRMTVINVRMTLIGRIATGLATIFALVAAVGSINTALTADDATILVETWRTIGFFTFAGLFVLLTFKPTVSLGLWLIVILNKVALVVAAIYLPDAIGANDVLLWDSVLVGLLLIGLAGARQLRSQGADGAS